MAARLTDAAIRNAKASDKAYKLSDGEALHLLVARAPSSSKLWRYRYRIGGVENLYAIGEYPAVSLQQARELRDAARRLVKDGIHPAHQRKAARLATAAEAANTFEAVADEWVAQQSSHWSPYYLKQVRTVFRNDVYPAIGGLPIRVVTAAQLLAIVKAIEARQAPSIALLARQWMSAVFRYAVATLRADTDPASALKGAIRKPKTVHKRPLAGSEVHVLLGRLADGGSGARVSAALRILLLTFVRPGELRGAKWCEFDLDKAEWRVPAERMKMRQEHIVPLSRQALAVLEELKGLPSPLGWLFPNVRDPRRAMSPTTLNRALERMGYGGKFSAHGFRATASTMLNEMGYGADAIERQLAHGERNKVRASYNQAAYLPARRTMMQQWSDHIDELVAKSNVTPIRSRAAARSR